MTGKKDEDWDLGRGDDRFARGAFNRDQPSWKKRKPLPSRRDVSLLKRLIAALKR